MGAGECEEWVRGSVRMGVRECEEWLRGSVNHWCGGV